MQVRELDSTAMSEWDAYVANHAESSAYHQSGWRRIIEQVFSRETYYLLAEQNGEPRGVLPLVRLKSLAFGDFLVSMPYLNYGGLLASDDAAVAALAESSRALTERLGVRHTELRHTRELLDLPARTDRVCMHLALPDDAETLWSQIGSKLRAQIKRPKREGAQLEVGGPELLDEFYPIFAQKYRQLGVPVYPRRWFDALLQEFPEDISIQLVRLNGVCAAASVVIRFRGSSEVAWAASLREFDRLGANMLLYWGMLENAIKAGSSVFDFGRTAPGSGTHRFKKQWGAEPVPLYWHYQLGTATEMPQLNLDNPKFERAAAIWRRLPLWMTTTIGPMVVKNLP